MSVSLKHTLDQGREEFKAAAYAAPPSDHDPDIKEKPRAPKPAASPFNASSSSSSSSSAPHNNNVQDSEIVVSDGEVSVDSDYTSNPVEANKVHVERAKRRRAKAPCLQPLVLTRRQQAIANAIV